MKCKYHLCDNELYGRQTVFCSKVCKNKFYVKKRRKNLKIEAVDYKGGKCECCGYNSCIDALEFHHLDPSEKDFGISKNGDTRSWIRVKEELDKCILVCSNCHREIHAGIRPIV